MGPVGLSIETMDYYRTKATVQNVVALNLPERQPQQDTQFKFASIFIDQLGKRSTKRSLNLHAITRREGSKHT